MKSKNIHPIFFRSSSQENLIIDNESKLKYDQLNKRNYQMCQNKVNVGMNFQEKKRLNDCKKYSEIQQKYKNIYRSNSVVKLNVNGNKNKNSFKPNINNQNSNFRCHYSIHHKQNPAIMLEYQTFLKMNLHLLIHYQNLLLKR